MTPLTFRNSKIVYYGPHSCENCGAAIVKMGREWGGTAFNHPEGPIYPNTEWHPHVCDPAMVKKQIGDRAAARVTQDWPNAHAYQVGELGYVILAEPCAPDARYALVISPNCNYHDTDESAWAAALRRQTENLPTWHLDLGKYQNAKFSDDLQRLPECPTAAV